MSARDRLFGFTPPLGENGISSAHLMVENIYLFRLESFFNPGLHVLYIGLGDDGGFFEIIVGIRECLLYNFEPMYVQIKLALSAANVSNAYVFYISIFNVGLSSVRQMIDGDVDRERFFSGLAFVEIESPQIANLTADCHDR